jgi:hypothetical protein
MSGMTARRDARQPSAKLTLSMAIEIVEMVDSGMFQNRVAAHFDINPGRVAEVMSGQRFPEARFIARSRR